jgi:hypothetical protein
MMCARMVAADEKDLISRTGRNVTMSGWIKIGAEFITFLARSCRFRILRSLTGLKRQDMLNASSSHFDPGLKNFPHVLGFPLRGGPRDGSVVSFLHFGGAHGSTKNAPLAARMSPASSKPFDLGPKLVSAELHHRHRARSGDNGRHPGRLAADHTSAPSIHVRST